MVKVIDIYNYIDSFAPFDTAMSFDNAGLLVGDGDEEVTSVVVALDITSKVVEEAKKSGAQLIVSHHPVIFDPVKKLSFKSVPALLAANNISAICAHTNLDKSLIFGVNKTLAEACGLIDFNLMEGEECVFTAETTKALTSQELAEQIKVGLDCKSVAFTDCNDKIKKVGMCSGSGGDGIFAAIAHGCDAYLTGEIRHHEILAGNESGISVFAVGHYKSEDIVIAPLAEKLAEKFPEVKFRKSNTCTDGIEFI